MTRTIRRPSSVLWPTAGTWPAYRVISPSVLRKVQRLSPEAKGRPEGLERGYFVKPTVFANVHNEMTIAREEIFGPVLSILTYRDEEEAISMANASDYGLHAYVFSSNVPRANAVAARLEAGRVMVNTLQNDALAPFGGVQPIRLRPGIRPAGSGVVSGAEGDYRQRGSA